MCYFNLDDVKNSPKSEMSLQLFKKIAADVFPISQKLLLSVGAEPFMSRSFPEMLQIAATYNIPSISFVTNGTLLTPQHIEQIIAAGVHEMIVSVDGATAETYEAIRRGANFDRLIENLRILQQMKAEYHSAIPEIRFSVVLMRKNIKELPAILTLAKELGVKYVGGAHLVVYEGLDMKEESLSAHRELANSYLDEARELARKLNISFAAPPDFPLSDISETSSPSDAASSGKHCHWPWNEILIYPDGTVYPCCYWYETGRMGDFSTQRFDEIWNGEQYRQLRRELTTKSLRETCRKCPIGKDTGDFDEQAFTEKRVI
jgi:radical SAM protein with 4Fe4S-binding SPASM domain